MNVGILSKKDLDDANAGKALGAPNMFRALVDTGAMSTCITSDVAKKVGLSPIGKVPVVGVSGSSFHNNYLFYVAFTLSVIDPSNPGKQGLMTHIADKPIQGAELLMGTGFDVLLGMDIISTGSLAVEGIGTYSFSF